MYKNKINQNTVPEKLVWLFCYTLRVMCIFSHFHEKYKDKRSKYWSEMRLVLCVIVITVCNGFISNFHIDVKKKKRFFYLCELWYAQKLN